MQNRTITVAFLVALHLALSSAAGNHASAAAPPA